MNSSDTVLSPITRAMIHYVSARGVDSSAFCQAAGIPHSVIINPDEKFSFKMLNTAWREAAALTGDPTIGLHVGEFLDLSALGVVGYLLQSSQTLGEAIETASRYTTLTGGVIDLSYAVDQKHCTITCGLQQSFPDSIAFAIRQLQDAAMAIGVTMLDRLTHQVVNPLMVAFTYPQPADLSEYQRIFKTMPLFEQKGNILVYGREMHELPVTFSNPTLHALFEKHAQAMLISLQKQTDIASKVKMVIMERMRDEGLSLQMVADELFMSSRTVQRKLASEGTSFQALLDEVRGDLAEDYLIRLGLSVTDAAFLLGLSEPSAFVRSFKRRTGQPPAEYKKQHKKVVTAV